MSELRSDPQSRSELPDAHAVRDFLVSEARRLGFHRAAIVPIEPPMRYRAYREWTEASMHGTMSYMAAPEHLAARTNIGQLAETARSLIVVALAYDHRQPERTRLPVHPVPGQPSAAPIRGQVARYARGADYHGVIKRRLYALAESLSGYLGRPVAARPCTDSAPVLERDYAERAGLGFIAKNTMLITPGLGSYTLLGEMLLDVEAAPSATARPRPRCGTCSACMSACPTGAFVDAYVLDARRCISYLTIEHNGPIERSLRPHIGTMIFGCDICQEVCPFNARAPERTTPDPELLPRDAERGAPDLLALLALGSNQRRRYVAGTPLRRVSREKLVRNLCTALGNAGDKRAIEPLTGVLHRDRSPVARLHAAWALGRLGARQPLWTAFAGTGQQREDDPDVRAEIALCLAELDADATMTP